MCAQYISRNVTISNASKIFTDSIHLCYDSDAVFLTNKITCSVAGCSTLRDFNHYADFLNRNGTYSLLLVNDLVTVRKLEIACILSLMRMIVPNEYPTHVRVSKSQFVGLNVEILFSLAITRKPYRVQGVGGSYVKATRASS